MTPGGADIDEEQPPGSRRIQADTYIITVRNWYGDCQVEEVRYHISAVMALDFGLSAYSEDCLALLGLQKIL